MNYLGLLACIAPLYLIVYTYKNDRSEKEPKALIFKLFLFGCLSVIPIIIVESILSTLAEYLCLDSFYYNLFDAFVVAGFSEETFKFIFLKAGSFNNKAFDTSYDGIIYAVTVSMGFAIVENILYCITSDISTVISRSILSIPAHAAFGVMMGIFYARAKLYKDYGKLGLYASNKNKAILFPILFHGLYDFCLMQSGYYIYVFIVVMIIIYILLFRSVKAMSKQDYRI